MSAGKGRRPFFYGKSRNRDKVRIWADPICTACGHGFLSGSGYKLCPDCLENSPVFQEGTRKDLYELTQNESFYGVRLFHGFQMVRLGSLSEEYPLYHEQKYREEIALEAAMAGRNAASRDMRQAKPDYRMWIEFRAEVDRLREHYSWTQISKLAGKGNNGWAANAYEHRGITTDRDVELLRAIEAPVKVSKAITGEEALMKNEKGTRAGRPVGRLLTFVETVEFRTLLVFLNERKGWTRSRIAEKIGYQSGWAVSLIMDEKNNGSIERLEAARAVIRAEWSERQLQLLQADAFTNTKPVDPAEVSDGCKYCGGPNPHVGEEGSEGCVDCRVGWPLSKVKAAEPELQKQADPEDARKVAEPAKPIDPWAWLDEIQEQLLVMVMRVEREEQMFLESVPEAFRKGLGQPFEDKRRVLEDALGEFQR